MLYPFASAVAAVGRGGYRVFLLGMGVGRVAALLLLVAMVAPAHSQYLGPRADYMGGQQPLRNPVVVDVSGDGIRDVVTGNSYSNNVSVYLGRSGGQFAARVDYATALGPTKVVVTDVNGDAIPDIVTANGNLGRAAEAVSILMGTGGGVFGPHIDYAMPGLPGLFSNLVLMDATGDGQPDIMVDGWTLPGLGGGGFGPVIASPFIVSDLVDVNGDGRPDLLSYTSTPLATTVALALPGGGFGVPAAYPYIYLPVVGDVNGDGYPDLVPGYTSSSAISILLGQAGGTFGGTTVATTEPRPAVTYSGFWVAVGDITGDGRADIITTSYETRNTTVVPALPTGSFGPYTTHYHGAFPATNYPIAAAVTDLNADGRMDVVTGNVFGISVYLNQSTPTATLIDQSGTAAALTLSPNPAHATCTLSGLPATAGPATATLHNALGQRVRTVALAPVGGQVALSVAGLPAGVYTVRVQAGGLAVVRRLVVE